MWSLYKTKNGIEYYTYGRAKLEVSHCTDGDFYGVAHGEGWEERFVGSKEDVLTELLKYARLHGGLPYKVEFWYGGLPVVKNNGKFFRVNHNGSEFVLENI